MDAFARSELYRAFATNPSFVNITSKTYGVLDGPTEVTRASLAAAAA
jgi:hypothetical protein